MKIDSVILRNEPFGGVYFNQRNGRMMMVDGTGFMVLLKHLTNEILNKNEKMFVEFFFYNSIPESVKIKIDKSAYLTKEESLITNSPVFIDLSLNNYCNLHCPYCYMDAKTREEGESLSIEDFELLLQQMVKNRVIQVALGGGEPTMHPNFIEILRKLRIEGDIIPNYTTNGSNLSPKIIEATKKYCGAVAVSYSEDRLDQTINTVKEFVRNGIKTNLHIVLLRSHIPKLTKITETFAKLGISNVVLLLFKPIGRGHLLQEEVLDIKNKQSLSLEIVKIINLRKKYNIKLSIDACSVFAVKNFPFLPESIQGCTGGIYSCYIDWNLQMKPCSFMQDVKGINLKKIGISEAWNSSFFKGFRRMILNPRFSGCITCDYFSICSGGCPIKPELVFCSEKGEKIKEVELKLEF